MTEQEETKTYFYLSERCSSFLQFFGKVQAKKQTVTGPCCKVSNSFVTARYNSVLSCKAHQNISRSKPQRNCRHTHSSLLDLCS